MRIFRSTFAISLIALFSCSKDDSVTNPGTSGPEEPEIMKGIFIDSEVSGLTFSTETQDGITNENGEFFYYEGEAVTFSVNDIKLGSGEGDLQMTPLSIASTPNATIESEEVKNIAAFLQSLDSDANPSNGISIDPVVVESITISEIDFTENIVTLLGEMVAELNLTTDSDLKAVYPEEAAVHMAENIGEEYVSVDHVFSSFLPTFTHHYGGAAATSTYWVHQTNGDGLLVKSSKFEKYPNVKKSEIEYTKHNELGLPIEYQLINIANNFSSDPSFFTINYSTENQIQRINVLDPTNGEITTSVLFKKIDENQRVLVSYILDNTGDFVQRQERVLDEKGNTIETNIYNAETGGEPMSNQAFTYTDFGDPDQVTRIGNGQTEWTKYYYREDRTLEKVESTFSNSEAKNTLEYNENEVLTKAILDWVWTTVVRYFHENGVRSKEEHYDENGNLTRIDTFDEEGNLTSRETY